MIKGLLYEVFDQYFGNESMSEKSQKIIKYFCDRFLDVDYYPIKFSAILDLSISKLRNIDEDSDINQLLKKQGINKIRDFSEISNDQIASLINLNKKTIDRTVIYNSIIAANLISNAWQKRKLYEEKSKLKVVMAGLDYAGKTSLINRLISNKSFSKTTNPEPTIGHNIEEFETPEFELVLWDLGGQKAHIQEYLQEPELYFVQLDILIFVIDIQDDLRYDDALNYLKDIINMLDFLDERPYLLLLLNKADSDIYNDPDFQIKMEYIVDKIENLFLNIESAWNFEVIPTSIYNFYSFEPSIVKNIKSIFSVTEKSKKESEIIEEIKDRDSEINEKLERILDINFKYMDQILEEITIMRRALNRIAPMKVASEYFNVPFMLSGEQSKETDNPKEHAKRRKNKGIPQKLDRKQAQSFPSEEKIHANILQETRKNLISVNSNGGPSIPPMAPHALKQDISIKKSTLNPPPVNPPKATHNFRKEIISELKEIFIKKGIAK